jgi:hypothetical protein
VRLARAVLDSVHEHTAVGGHLLAARSVVAMERDEASADALVAEADRALSEVGRA